MLLRPLGAILTTLIGFAGFALTAYAREQDAPYSVMLYTLGTLILISSLIGAGAILFARDEHMTKKEMD